MDTGANSRNWEVPTIPINSKGRFQHLPPLRISLTQSN